MIHCLQKAGSGGSLGGGGCEHIFSYATPPQGSTVLVLERQMQQTGSMVDLFNIRAGENAKVGRA